MLLRKLRQFIEGQQRNLAALPCVAIALKLHAAGCVRTAQDILDNAIDAATNIRQSSLRDEVFDELGLAIRIMQEMER